jgi:hypothetical protein
MGRHTAVCESQILSSARSRSSAKGLNIAIGKPDLTGFYDARCDPVRPYRFGFEPPQPTKH